MFAGLADVMTDREPAGLFSGASNAKPTLSNGLLQGASRAAQTNINARICFRVNELQASMRVLGNKSAMDLPEVKGRGIWSVGSQNFIVQAPKLSNEELADQVESLLEKFNGEVSPLKQKMIFDNEVSQAVDPFAAKDASPDDSSETEAA